MLHPFEVAAGMDVSVVKKQYGNKLSMRGGVDKREIAKDFSAIDMEIKRIQPAFEAGGYIPHFDHSVPPNISWDNYRYYIEKLTSMLLVARRLAGWVRCCFSGLPCRRSRGS